MHLGTLCRWRLIMKENHTTRTFGGSMGKSQTLGDNDSSRDEVEFDSGAVRSADCEGLRYDLISPVGLEAVARACHEGAERYGDFNWEKGMPVGDLLNHAVRHIYQFLGGNRDEDHLGHAAWGLLAAIHSHELWPDLNEYSLREDWCTPPEDF